MMHRHSPVKPHRGQRAALLMSSTLVGALTRRKRYCLQILKQFVLFPGESDSSDPSISQYDRLIFNDQELHTLFKKIETKLLEAKLWGFLNLRAYRYVEAVRKMAQPIKRLKRRVESELKGYAFDRIRVHVRQKHLLEQDLITGKIPIVTPPKNRAHQSHHKPTSPQPQTQSSYTKITITQTEVDEEWLESPRRQEYPTGSGQAQVTRRNRLASEPQGSNWSGRSRSGSITRFEYVNGQRLLLNGEVIPCHIGVQRSQSPLKEPEYIRLQSPGSSCKEDILYRGRNRGALQGRNVEEEYASGVRPTRTRNRSSSRIIYVEHPKAQASGENSSLCGHCSPGKKKVKRLRSGSKPQQGYVQHLK